MPYKLTLFSCFFLSMLLFACSSNNKKEASQASLNLNIPTIDSVDIDYESYHQIETYIYSGEMDTSLVQEIDSACVIMVHPNEKQIDEMEKELGEEVLSTIADDNSWYQSLVLQNADSANVKIIFAKKDILHLKGTSQNWDLNIRTKKTPEWNVILFNPGKTPLFPDITTLSTKDLEMFFNEK